MATSKTNHVALFLNVGTTPPPLRKKRRVGTGLMSFPFALSLYVI